MRSGKINSAVFVIGFIGLLLFWQNTGNAQETEEMDQWMELLADEYEGEVPAEELLELLHYFYKKPLNLNKASSEQLRELHLLNDWQIRALLEYRSTNGNLISIYELQSIPHFDPATIKRILPFTDVKGDIDDYQVPVRDLFTKGEHQLFVRYNRTLESKRGYESSKYHDPVYYGLPFKLYVRHRYRHGTKASYGITAEKDPGEALFSGPNKKGFDFYSAHLYLKDRKLFKYLALGDYQLNFGQGLIIWSGLSFRKSSRVMNIKKDARTVMPYSSVDENRYFRGLQPL